MIESYSYGKIVVGGSTYTHDIKILSGRVVTNWKLKSGHRLTIEDLPDILSIRPNILVVGCGFSGNMAVDDSLRSVLKEANIELIVKPTAEAVEIFNSRFENEERVAGGFHLKG